MKYLIIVSLIILIVLIIINNKKTELKVNEAKKLIEKNYFDFIVDVRTKSEWDEGHHPQAVHIPIGEFVTKLPEMIPDKNKKILFYCKKGFRASGALQIAKKLGYENIYYLDDQGKNFF